MIAQQAHRRVPGSTLNLGLVGVGRWGARYVSTLAGVDGVRLALAVSRNPVTRDCVPAGCEVLDDWRAALAAGRLDGLILATPPAVHYEMARACVDVGLPVLVEKPLTSNLKQAQELARAAARQDSLVMVDHTHLFSSAFAALKSRAARVEGPLRIRGVGGNYGPFREDTDALWDWGPHDVSMCLDLLGEPPLAVAARPSPAHAGGEARGLVVEARLEFAGGARAELLFGNLLPAKRRWFEVKGSNATLVYDDLAPSKLVEQDDRGSWQPIGLSAVPPLARAVAAFRDAIAAGDTHHASLPLGVHVVETLERTDAALGQCSRTGSAARSQARPHWDPAQRR
jgi:predicted dehydrogenase